MQLEIQACGSNSAYGDTSQARRWRARCKLACSQGMPAGPWLLCVNHGMMFTYMHGIPNMNAGTLREYRLQNNLSRPCAYLETKVSYIDISSNCYISAGSADHL